MFRYLLGSSSGIRVKVRIAQRELTLEGFATYIINSLSDLLWCMEYFQFFFGHLTNIIEMFSDF
jgi:hypothetical protein